MGKFQKGNPKFQKGNPKFQKGNPKFQKGGIPNSKVAFIIFL
jgi:hypothetical protein